MLIIIRAWARAVACHRKVEPKKKKTKNIRKTRNDKIVDRKDQARSSGDSHLRRRKRKIKRRRNNDNDQEKEVLKR